jgi:phosphate transport system substrate-binding protein
MMRGSIWVLALAFLFSLPLSVHAVDGGRVLFYGGAGQGRVIFDGRTHASAGLRCNDCHSALFETRKKALITMDDHSAGKACFACHDGKRAFSDCNQCHRKI